MKNQSRCATMALALATLAAAATTASAADLFWQGGTGAVNDPNYFKPSTGATNVAPPATNDFEYVGGNGTVTLSDTQTVNLARLRIGHNFTTGGAQGPAGPGTFTVTGGSLTLAGTTVGGSSSDTEGSAGALILGYNESALMNISGGTVTVGRYISVGLDNTNDSISNVAGATATLNISGTGTVAVTHASNAASTVYVGNGVAGSLTVSDSGTLKATSNTVDLKIGVSSPGTFTQTGGTTSFTSSIAVGLNNVAGASMNVSGGTVSTGTGFTVGAASGSNTTNASATFSGTSAVTINGALTVGANASTGSSLTISGNADVKVGTGGSNNVFIGRGTTDNTTFTMTGGSLSATKYFLMGTGNTTAGVTSRPTNILGNHSGGTITTGDSFVLADAGGQSTYNLSGTGAIVSNGRVIVGRQLATATLNQTGGSVTANFAVRVGDATVTDATTFGSGFYNISGGSLTATVPAASSTVDALSIAPAGTGTFRVIGGDATINVTGNMAVNYTAAADPNPAFVGTLAYQFQAGESLSEIMVTGNATFATGSVLSLDLNGTTPAQTSYDLLTAADVIDSGLSLAFPAGWNYRIVTGGNGEILQAFKQVTRFPGDTNSDGVVDLTDLNNVLNNFGATGTNPGDDNGDSVVDLTDLNNVLNNFGATHAAGALASVPEPASLSLLAIGATALMARRRRARA